MKNLTALSLMSCVVAVIFMAAASIAYAWQEGAGKGAEPSATVEVDLSELNDSGVSGTATLMPVGNNQTKVTIELTGAPEGGTHPVHIHKGTCESLGGVEYPLGDIKNGKSVTVIDTSLDTLTAESYAINVHKSSDEASVYVACGTTGEKGEEMASGAVEVELSEVSDSGVTGMATLTPMDGQTKVVINLTGAPEGGVHPVHIHKGTCDSLGEAAYPLNDIQNGTSETVIDADLKSLTTGSHAINVHKSSSEASTYVACGTIHKSDHMH